ncbi:uncharacterized protein G2W53_006327 [Senna tora]|uniref:CW-type domain-containing protein n=1 Tax=Senna tora TaxID=362788 RepID=A0A834X4K5_9FABA|nr:uncharacterized protein G2W53_006327 [Senna tora]
MEEDTELEEGEACYYKDDDDSFDIESLSYIDERIQHVLGHFQKDFEGGVSAENLGAKFGGYGSFLPTYERSPPSRSHPKTPQRIYISPKSPNNHHVEAASDNSKAPSNGSPSIRLGTVPHSAHSFHNARVPSVNDSVKKDIGVFSNVGVESCPLKDDSTSKSGNSTDQRTLKFRIKTKPDNVAQKKAEIYSGLGLDISPSSMENSPEEIGRMPQASQETGEESPIGIIQAMTSFPIPGGALISPLHDNLLCLIRKEKVLGDRKSLSSFNGQEYCSMSTDELDSIVGEEQVLKERKVKILHSNKRLGNKTPNAKDLLSNDLKYTPLSSSICNAGEAAEVTERASKVSKKVNKDGENGRMRSSEERASEVSKKVNKDGENARMRSSEAVKEESLESIPGQDFDKSEKQHMGNGSMLKVIDHELANSLKDNSIDPSNNSNCKGYMISKKEKLDVTKFKVGHRKPLSDGKYKPMGDQSPSKAMAVAKKDSFEAVNNAIINDKKSAGFDDNCKSKMLETKSLKDNKFKDTDPLKGHKSERTVNGIDPGGLPGHRAVINANHDNFEKQNVYQVKAKERPRSNKMGDKSMAGPGIRDASNECSVAGMKSAPEIVQIASAPHLIEENWVCCDRCQKWRLLPVGIKPDQLPEKWLCSMLNWLPGMNRCDISEEMTTKALYGLCQMPNSESQNNIQRENATGTAIVVGSAEALQFGLSYQNSSSDVLSDHGKKKLDFKEKKKAGISTDKLLVSDSAQNNAQEAGKTKSDQHPVDLNPMRKPGSQRLGKLNNLMEVKHSPKEKDQKMNGGDRKHIKLNHKMDADQYKSGTPKKSKTEDFWSADKQLNPSMNLEKEGQNSRNGFPTKASGKDMRKYDEYCLSDDVQNKLVVPVKKQGDQAQVSTDGESLDVKRNRKRDASMKKRKLEDRKDTDKPNDAFSLQDDKQYGEGSLSGYRKEKMFKVINMEEKSVFENNDKINRKGGSTQGCLSMSGRKNHAAVAAEEVGSVDKVYQPRKHSKKIASHKVLDAVDPLGRDLGSGQVSSAATSSSSKFSGSHKARTNFEHTKGSPVESVTSSPIRVSNLDKLILAEGDTSDKDNATKGVLSSVSSRRYLDNREGKLSVKVKERVLYDLPPESHNCVSKDFLVEDAKNKTMIQAKTSEVRDDHLVNGDAATVKQHGDCANHGDKVNKCNQESELSWQKSGKVSLRGKERDRRSGSVVDKNKMKVSASENGYSKNGGRYESAVDPSYHASGHGTRNYAKCSLTESKREIDNTGKKNSVRHWPSEIETQTELKQKDSENPSLKADAPCSTKKEVLSRSNLIEGFVDENKAVKLWSESQDRKSKVLSSLESEEKRETLSGSRTAPGSQMGGVLTEHPVHASSNGDEAKLMKSSTGASSKGGFNCSPENFGPDRQLTVSTSVTNSSQNVHDTLKEATNLRDRADHFKNTGFEFESKETYFEAALKFLHGASLLENFHKESGKYGDMSQMQIYTTAAKLFESCAHEYERHHEMPSAALAYKCMEVAYMRVVYCKYSGANRDRHELQSTLQVVPQGESPSSSASDVDNLNNQAAVYKSILPRGTTGAHVAGNQVISTRNHSNFVRLLDFTQDVNYAMEASRKCLKTLAAANVTMEEARNKESITSIRRVVDLSFQDVDELVDLVWIATKAISRADLGDARD